MNAILSGARHLTISQSLKMDSELGFPEGFFAIIQTYYQIALAKKGKAEYKTAPTIRKSVFWDIDPDKLDWNTNKEFIVSRVNQRGSKEEIEKVNEYYSTDLDIDGIRFASPEQVVAMKMQAIATGGRKKDWWDIHMLLEYFSLEEMLDLHKRWQPWTHDRQQLLEALTDFSVADTQPDPRCLFGKDWDFIKLDIIDAVTAIL